MNEEMAERLRESGWAILQWPVTAELLSFAPQLGIPVASRAGRPLVDTLSPINADQARPKSMSAVYGMSPLPPHTDLANIRLPPRWVVLRLAQGYESDRPTVIVDSRELKLDEHERRRLHNDIWLVNGGRGRFYTSLFNDTLMTRGTILRFDPCCMRPATSRAAESALLFRRAVEGVRSIQIDWTDGRVLVLDNWRVLHGRGPVNRVVKTLRALERVLIASNNTEETHGLGF